MWTIHTDTLAECFVTGSTMYQHHDKIQNPIVTVTTETNCLHCLHNWGWELSTTCRKHHYTLQYHTEVVCYHTQVVLLWRWNCFVGWLQCRSNTCCVRLLDTLYLCFWVQYGCCRNGGSSRAWSFEYLAQRWLCLWIDYFIVSKSLKSVVVDFEITEDGTFISDHWPMVMSSEGRVGIRMSVTIVTLL